jgi:threonine aldolase
LNVHLDGARVFNAAVALGVDVEDLTKGADSMMFCMSKGLSAPVGSIVAGSEELVETARRYRKMLGGGMRQAGIIAAAGIVALETMVDRLAEDHANAKLIARRLSKVPGLSIDMERVQTNIIFVDFSKLGVSKEEIERRFDEQGVKLIALGDTQFRIVTHYGIEREDAERACDVIEDVCGKIRKGR